MRTTYRYDMRGHQVSVTWPDNTSRTVRYNVAEDPDRTADFNSAGAKLRESTAVFDLASRRTAATDALGAATTWDFDALGAVIAQSEPVRSGASITSTFGYYPVGNPTRFTDGRGSAFLTLSDPFAHIPLPR